MMEKRKHERLPVSYDVFITTPNRSLQVKSRDISPHGVGIFVDHALENGALVDLIVSPGEGIHNISLKGAIRYCEENPRQSGDGASFLAGIEFNEESQRDLPYFEITANSMTFKASHSVPIEAPADHCYQLMGDFTRYRDWTKVIESVKILNRHADGRARQVEFTANALFRKVRYVLDYSYDDANHCLSWESVGGDFARVTGRYYFQAQGPARSSSTYQLNVVFDFYIPDRIANYFSGIMMRKSMKDFKKLAEKEYRH